jgi:hypothetical protein
MMKKQKKSNRFKMFLALAAAVFVIVLIRSFSDRTGSSRLSRNSMPAGSGQTIEVSGIAMNDFTKNPIKVGRLEEITFILTTEYNATYYPKDEGFLIVVTSYPFEEYRRLAEEEFLKKLDISRAEACKLKVYETTPRVFNPDESGINHRLSFCR